ncbi:hypothetical protein IC582_008641 [Cucumis melo]
MAVLVHYRRRGSSGGVVTVFLLRRRRCACTTVTQRSNALRIPVTKQIQQQHKIVLPFIISGETSSLELRSFSSWGRKKKTQ